MSRYLVFLIAAGAVFAQAPASVTKAVDVPLSMRSSPFDVARTLVVPPDFSVSVLARVSGARFMAAAPNGDILVSNPGAGRVTLVRPNAGADPSIFTFVSGLRNPHDMVFHTVGTVTYLFIAESHQINRYIYNNGDTTGQGRQVVIPGLPDASSPELGGSYGHQLKNIAVSQDNKLYVSIASATNASTSDATSTPVRCAVYQYDLDGSNGRLFGRGLRNAEGLAFVPGTTTLWVTVNQRDNTPFPYRQDWDGNGSDDFGKVMQSYVDNHPPDSFTRVLDGGDYGWPYANPNPDTPNGLTNMPYDPDYNNNPLWSVFPESRFTRVDKGIQAHSAPLGFSFFQNTSVPAAYRNGAGVALHGSWNRSTKTGYKVIYYPWQGTGMPADQMDLVRGWLNDATQSAWGRPVDVIADPQGNFLISDDQSGTIYKLSYTPPDPNPAMTVSRVMIRNADTEAVVGQLNNGAVIDLAVLPRFNLVAETSPSVVGSVHFGGTASPGGGGNAATILRVDNQSPYTIGGDNGAQDVLPWDPTAGTGAYQLRVTPYAGADRSGNPGTPLDLSFTVTNARPTVVTFSLLNADTDQPIAGFHPIQPGAVIRLSALGTSRLSFQAFTNPGVVGSVRLTLSGALGKNNVDADSPYVLSNDKKGDIQPLNPSLIPGSYTLSGTPYSGNRANGTVGATGSVSFTVVN